MKKERMIEKESIKCRAVVEAFHELFAQTDIYVADCDKYGFVKLEMYSKGKFQSMDTFHDSNALFEELWQAWMDHTIFRYGQTHRIEGTYEEIFLQMPEEERNDLLSQRKVFQKNIEDITENDSHEE